MIQNVGLAVAVILIAGGSAVAQEVRPKVPADAWRPDLKLVDYGGLFGSQGSYGVSLSWNGTRRRFPVNSPNNGKWRSLGLTYQMTNNNGEVIGHKEIREVFSLELSHSGFRFFANRVKDSNQLFSPQEKLRVSPDIVKVSGRFLVAGPGAEARVDGQLRAFGSGDSAGKFEPEKWQAHFGKVGAGYVALGSVEGQPALQGAGTNTSYRLSLNPFHGNVGIRTLNPQAELDVNGTARVRILEITGGQDLAEGFDTGGSKLAPGTLLVIDPERSGALRASEEPYDSKVAGVVSGAGGLSAGVLLSMDGVSDQESLVAMTGRAWVKCCAENGRIRPGDRLTTSSTPGHAMRATDRERSDGAVLGKAMSALEGDEGMVLVLVNLQ